MDSSDRIQPPSSSPELTAPMSTSTENKRPPNQEQGPVNCPRCDSPNTKFCYYNNYSLTQPRYFCKSCRRYWTKGGTLRNIPVGGVCRKNKKLSSISRKPITGTTHSRRQSPDGNGNGMNPTLNSLQLSYPGSPADVSAYSNFMESGGGGGEYEGAGSFPGMVGSGGYGVGTGNTHGFNLFGEMEHYENMMNEVDLKPRVFSFGWEEQTGCHSDVYGSGEGRNGSFSYLMGLGSYRTD